MLVRKFFYLSNNNKDKMEAMNKLTEALLEKVDGEKKANKIKFKIQQSCTYNILFNISSNSLH